MAKPPIANLEEITLLEHFKGPEEFHQRVRSHGGLDRRVLAVAVNEELGGAVDVDVGKSRVSTLDDPHFERRVFRGRDEK